MKVLHSPQPRGAILAFALLCSAVAVVGMAYWISAIATRGRYVDMLYEGSKRRLSRENGRVMATRYVQMRVLPSDSGGTFSRGVGTYFSATGHYDWGGIALTEAWSGSPLSSVTPNIGVNRISFADAFGFGLRTADGTGFDLPISVLDGTQSWSYRWQARSYSPFLAGDLLVVYRPRSGAPEVAVTGNITVHGRALFWVTEAGPTLDASVVFETYATSGPPLAVPTAAGFMVGNYPPVWHLAWASRTEAPYDGGSNVVWDQAVPGTSLKNKALDSKTMPALYIVNGGTTSTSSNGYSSDGAGNVTVDLSNPTLDVVVIENAANIQFRGQTTSTAWNDVATYPSVLVVYHQAAGSVHSLTGIQFSEKNNRRVVFGVRKEVEQAAVAVTFPDVSSGMAGVGPDYRLMAHFESTPVSLSYAGTALNLTGGITTDRSLGAPAGAGQMLHVYREVVPLGLTSKSARRAWSEGFRLDE